MAKAKVVDFIPDSHNANKGTLRGMSALETSIRELGLGRSILVDKNNRVIAGNKTQQTAVDVGIEDAIVVETDGKQLVVVKRTDVDLHEATGRRLAYADNRTAELNLEWDVEALLADLQDSELKLDTLFYEDEIKELLEGIEQPKTIEDTGGQTDKADELQAKWQVKRGDLWVIPSKSGKSVHRVLCGDSTLEADVQRLMQGELADLVVTDPPYGVEHKNETIPAPHKKHLGIANDDIEIEPFIENFLTTLKDFTGSYYIFGAYSQFPSWYTLLSKWRKVNQVLVWVKDNPVLARLHFNLQFEVIYHGYIQGSIWNGDGTQKDVLSYRNPNSFGYTKDDGVRNANNDSQQHPHQKPLDLFRDLICFSSNPMSMIYDPFLGSGTTLVACEQTGRQGRGIEISEKYCAVILQRLTDIGLTPILDSNSLG